MQEVENKNEIIEEEETEENGSNVYELGFLMLPSVDESKLPEAVYSIKSVVEKAGGEFISEGYPTLKPLSYTMFKVIGGKKQAFDQGYFGWLKFEVESSQIGAIKDEVQSIQDVLRVILIKTVKENTIYSDKILSKKEKSQKKLTQQPTDVPEEKSSDEEIDKSIDKLVTDEQK